MTRITIITSIILSVVFLNSQELKAAGTRKMDLNSNHAGVIVPGPASEDPHQQVPASAHPQPISHTKRVHGPSLEELPHIHHFHKERVKKIKKHHNKFWIIAKLILVLCHVGLLILGFIHATH